MGANAEEQVGQNVVLVTVGTSAITNEAIGRGGAANRDNLSLRSLVQAYLNEAEPNKVIRRNMKLFNQLVEAHQLFWEFWEKTPDARGDSQYRLHTSAELVSTSMLVRRRETWRPSRIVLLHSATNEGRMAAAINESIMSTIWQQERVERREIQGLDEHFTAVHLQLRETVQELQIGESDQVCINFTGGYKGVVPSLTMLAYSNSWKMFCLHEKGGSPMEIVFKEVEAVARPVGWIGAL